MAKRNHLRQILCQLGEENYWRGKDAVEGTQIFGATGSGKTSGSGRAFATALLRAGYGGLVLTAKADELETWKGYFKAAYGADADKEMHRRLVVLEPHCGFHFNPLSYEYYLRPTNDGPGSTQRVVNLFMTALGSGDGTVAPKEPFWDDALRELLTHAIDLLAFADGRIDGSGEFEPPPKSVGIQLTDIAKLISEGPKDAGQAEQLASGIGSFFSQKLQAAHGNFNNLKVGHPFEKDLRETLNYWLVRYPDMHHRTKSIVESSFAGKANDLIREPLRGLFCGASSKEASPEATFAGQVLRPGQWQVQQARSVRRKQPRSAEPP